MSASSLDQPMSAARAAAELLARVLYAECGHQGLRAVEALASLALNRARAALACPEARLRYSNGDASATTPERALIAVCRAPFQFPARHPRHPRHALFAEPMGSDPALAMCRRVAARAVAGALPDPTGGALLWHAEGRLPAWALGRAPVAEAGGLVFYAG